MHIYLDEKEIRQAIDAWCQHRLRMAVNDAEGEGIVFYAEDESYVAMGAKVEVEVPEIGRDVPVGDQSQSDRPGDRPEGQSPRGPRAPEDQPTQRDVPPQQDFFAPVIDQACQMAPHISREQIENILHGSEEVRSWKERESLPSKRVVDMVLQKLLERARVIKDKMADIDKAE